MLSCHGHFEVRDLRRWCLCRPVHLRASCNKLANSKKMLFEGQPDSLKVSRAKQWLSNNSRCPASHRLDYQVPIQLSQAPTNQIKSTAESRHQADKSPRKVNLDWAWKCENKGARLNSKVPHSGIKPSQCEIWWRPLGPGSQPNSDAKSRRQMIS